MKKKDYVRHNEDYNLISSSIQLAGIELSLINAMSTESILKTILSDYKNEYNYILIDYMPSPGMLTIKALVAINF